MGSMRHICSRLYLSLYGFALWTVGGLSVVVLWSWKRKDESGACRIIDKGNELMGYDSRLWSIGVEE